MTAPLLLLLLLTLLALTRDGTMSASVCPQGCACSSARLDCSRLPRNVTELQVQGMGFARLAEGAFRGLRHLRELDLKDNGLQDVEEDTFRPLESLSELCLSDNLLREVHPDLLSHNRQLYKLLLNNNPLMQAPVLRAPSLGWLEMDGCGLASLPPAMFKDTPGLMYLSMDRNNLTTLPRFLFRPLAKLRHLHAEDNQLISLAPDTFSNNLILEMVYLSGNQLTLPDSGPFLTVPSLLVLELPSNNLCHLSVEAFSELPMLRSLKLATNNLQTLPAGSFTMLKELKVLDLQKNNLTVVDPSLFKGFKNGTLINISGNPLECDCRLLIVERFPWKLNGVIVSSEIECPVETVTNCVHELENAFRPEDVEPSNHSSKNTTSTDLSVGNKTDESGNSTLLVPKITPSVLEKSPRLAMGIGGAVIIVMVLALSVGTFKACRTRQDDSCSYQDDVMIAEETHPICVDSFTWRGFVEPAKEEKETRPMAGPLTEC